MNELLSCIEVEPRTPARSAVIWLHGLGADGHDFEAIVPDLALPDELGIRFVFPNAPHLPVTVNGGMVMPAWYDIRDLERRLPEDVEGIRASGRRLLDLVAREEERGVPAHRIVLAGFSQGGAVALYAGLRHTQRLAGVLALSTYLVSADTLEAERSPANADTPIFQAHGLFDPMVPCDFGKAGHDRLVELGYAVEWHAYPMAHQVCMEEIRAVASWLERCLAD